MNLWIQPVSMNNRKSCPTCYAKLNGTEIVSVGEYIRAKFHNLFYACSLCFEKEKATQLKPFTFEYKARCGYRLPEWLEEKSNG